MQVLAARTRQDAYLHNETPWHHSLHSETLLDGIRHWKSLESLSDTLDLYKITPGEFKSHLYNVYLDVKDNIVSNVVESVEFGYEQKRIEIIKADWIWVYENTQTSSDYRESVRDVECPLALPFFFRGKSFPLCAAGSSIYVKIKWRDGNVPQRVSLFVEHGDEKYKPTSYDARIPVLHRDEYKYSFDNRGEVYKFPISANGKEVDSIYWYVSKADSWPPDTTTFNPNDTTDRINYYSVVDRAKFILNGKEYDEKDERHFKYYEPVRRGLMPADKNIYMRSWKDSPITLNPKSYNHIVITNQKRRLQKDNKIHTTNGEYGFEANYMLNLLCVGYKTLNISRKDKIKITS